MKCDLSCKNVLSRCQTKRRMGAATLEKKSKMKEKYQFKKKKKKKKPKRRMGVATQVYPFFGMTMTQVIRDIFTW